MKNVSPDGLANMLVSEPYLKHSSARRESGKIIVLSRERFLASKKSNSDHIASYPKDELEVGYKSIDTPDRVSDKRCGYRFQAEEATLRTMKQFAETYHDSYISECLLTAIGLEGQQGFIDALHYFGIVDEWQG